MDHRQRLLPHRGRRRGWPRKCLRAARRRRCGRSGRLHPRRLRLGPLDLADRSVLSEGHRARHRGRNRYDPRALQPGSGPRVEPRPPADLLAPRRGLIRPHPRIDRPVHGHRARQRPDPARHLQDRVPRVQVRFQPLVLHGGYARRGRHGHKVAGPGRVPVRPDVHARHPASPPALRCGHDRRGCLGRHRRLPCRPDRDAHNARRCGGPRRAGTRSEPDPRPHPRPR